MFASAAAPDGGRQNHPHTSKRDLPRDRQQLVELGQEINFGQIRNLPIHDGQPVLDPPPEIIRELKLGGDNGPRPERQSEDFLLKAQHLELFAFFDQLGNGVIEVLEIKHGLPFRILVREAAA